MKRASFIFAPQVSRTDVPCFVRTIRLPMAAKQATIKISAIGLYYATVNGQDVTDARLTPGWTSHKRALFQTYDITSLVHEGDNVLRIYVAGGWARGEIAYDPQWRVALDPRFHTCLAAVCDVTLADGQSMAVATNEDFEVWSSPYTEADIYQGERFDGTAAIHRLGYAMRDESAHPQLQPHDHPLVREQERLPVQRILRTPKGETVLDFGQNHAGYTEIRYRGKRGDRIRLSFAEILDKDGNFYNENYRASRNDIRYVLDGEREIYKPHFTFQGYRYVRLDDFPAEADASYFTSIVLHSDMRRIGDFRCGDPRINRLYSNILYGQKSNFIDVPTDCPQRDERLGWTGDAQVFCRTACIQYDVKAFFEKWLTDMALEQHKDGGIGRVVPKVFDDDTPSAAWGDAATVCPMEVYLAYGDRELLRRQYPMMRRWVDYMHAAGPEEYLWIGGTHFGDWLAKDVDDSYVGATQTDLIASAFFAHSTHLCLRAARILGEPTDDLLALYTNVRTAFRAAFMKDGLPVLYEGGEYTDPQRRPRLRPITQTGLALILHFHLYEPKEEEGLIRALTHLIRENGDRMSTGFVGTPYLLHALADHGEAKVAFDLLVSEKMPSWLFSVKHGATTIWEHWDSMGENGELHPADMNSFNHYAYGYVYDFIYGKAAGITVPDHGAGYRHVTLRPYPDRRLSPLAVSEQTPLGRLSVRWQYVRDGIRYDICIPHGCTATLMLPQAPVRTLTDGEYVFVCPSPDTP